LLTAATGAGSLPDEPLLAAGATATSVLGSKIVTAVLRVSLGAWAMDAAAPAAATIGAEAVPTGAADAVAVVEDAAELGAETDTDTSPLRAPEPGARTASSGGESWVARAALLST
jgi:hypothetical protein